MFERIVLCTIPVLSVLFASVIAVAFLHQCMMNLAQWMICSVISLKSTKKVTTFFLSRRRATVENVSVIRTFRTISASTFLPGPNCGFLENNLENELERFHFAPSDTNWLTSVKWPFMWILNLSDVFPMCFLPVSRQTTSQMMHFSGKTTVQTNCRWRIKEKEVPNLQRQRRNWRAAACGNTIKQNCTGNGLKRWSPFLSILAKWLQTMWKMHGTTWSMCRWRRHGWRAVWRWAFEIPQASS